MTTTSQCNCGFNPADFPVDEEDGPGPFVIVQVLKTDRKREEYKGNLVTRDASLLRHYPPHGEKGLYKVVQEVPTLREASHLLGFHYQEMLALADTIQSEEEHDHDL